MGYVSRCFGTKPRTSELESLGAGQVWGLPTKQMKHSRHRNSCAHPEKYHTHLLLYLLLSVTQGRRWWFTSLCPISLVATLIKISRKALLLETAASLL